MRHGRVGDGVDHHRPVLDDPALLVLLADHVAGGVLEEQQRRVGAVGELDELRRLLRLLAEQHAAGVGEDAQRIAVQAGPTGDQRRPVQRLELVELRAVDDAGDDLARVERRSSDRAARGRGGRPRRAPAGRRRRPDGGPSLRQLSRATMRRPRRIASSSSAARWSESPETRECISAPPSDSSSASSPVAIFSNGGPARNTLARSLTITTWSDMPGR